MEAISTAIVFKFKRQRERCLVFVVVFLDAFLEIEMKLVDSEYLDSFENHSQKNVNDILFPHFCLSI